MIDVFLIFLRLGLTSFGGPIAHLSYFRREFVERRGWLDEPFFAHIVAFCSILPGPTSSQVGMIVGLLRAGPGGAFAAWLGFTLPSALALTAFAAVVGSIDGVPGAGPRWFTGSLAGLTAAATAIVAYALLGMARAHCTDRSTQTIAVAAGALAVALAAGGGWQWVPIAAAALAGTLVYARDAPPAQSAPAVPDLPLPRAAPYVAGALFIVIAATAAAVEHASRTGLLLATIVRAGALVFGGGHVVLPLLQALVPAGLVGGRDFFAGYGATQAVPGPLFTFAAFLGAVNRSPLHGPLGAAIATALIFAPSFLLVFALLPALGALRAHPAAAGALRGANAGVVGLLGALLYSPLILMLGSSVWRIAIALAVFTLVGIWQSPTWIAVAAAAAAGAVAAAAGLAT